MRLRAVVAQAASTASRPGPATACAAPHRPPLARWLQTAAATMGKVSEAITAKLTMELTPVHLEVINESANHCVPKDSETHFKVVVVSEHFDGLSLIKRHRAVNAVLEEEIAGPVHALSIVARTPAQWAATEGAVSASPACLGGINK